VLSHLNHHADAATHAKQAIGTIEAVAAKDPADTRLRFATALAYEAMGDALSVERTHDPVRASAGSADSAFDWYRRSFEIMSAMQTEGVLAGGTLFGEETARLQSVARKVAAGR
jgi:hypothetical protein